MADEESEDEYELLPHREIEELKAELSKLKEFDIAPTKKLQVSLLELNTKLDKLITIFEDAGHEMRTEESSLSFSEKMHPILERMNKILDQNAEIASGILAVADLLKEKKSEAPAHPDFTTFASPMLQMGTPKPMGLPPIPPPPKRTFGI
ncbi:hypothetical protein J4211_03715 [Candidatus Woesearchaeota archaeon]|nr:hypothetical protein [Candidatus Woesearchaeota archaeon]